MDDTSLYGFVRLHGGGGGVATYSSFNGYDNVGTSNISMLQGLAGKVSPVEDYVYARTGDYQYVFAWGDLSLSGTDFSGSVDYAVYERTGNYNSSYTYTVYHDDAFSLHAGNYFVYSSLGNYPLIGGNDNVRWLAPLCVGLFIVAGLLLFILPFGFCRSRAG